ILKPIRDEEMPDDFYTNSVLLSEGEENLYYWLSHEVELLQWAHPMSREKIVAARTALKKYAHEYKHWKAASELQSVEKNRLGYEFHMVHPQGVREGAALISIPVTVTTGRMTTDEFVAMVTAPGNDMSPNDTYTLNQIQSTKNG
ncbi:MAG: hypothetical protein O3B87_05955, partial [bacterium]|nr:hypothetical protein [bacterium]